MILCHRLMMQPSLWLARVIKMCTDLLCGVSCTFNIFENPWTFLDSACLDEGGGNVRCTAANSRLSHGLYSPLDGLV
jgi:hypothetical protein